MQRSGNVQIAPNPSIHPTGRAVAPARVIVLGNEKGGSGKSTTAMHLVVALLRTGRSVGVIDLDARQGTLSRYVENRVAYARQNEIALPHPELRKVNRSEAATREEAEATEIGDLNEAVASLAHCDYLVMDTPGSDSHLSRLGHTLADILIIAPYNAQVAALSARLPGARIGTVDKFQGQEAPVVIYSMATSHPEDAPKGLGFLFSLNRLNVATSRTQAVVIIVGSPELLEADCKTPKQMRWVNGFCGAVELATATARGLI